MTEESLESFLQGLRLELARQRAADPEVEVEEVRQHVLDSIALEQLRDPAITREEATRRALDHFGTIEDYLAARPRPTTTARLRWGSVATRTRGWIVMGAVAIAILLVAAAITIGVSEQRERGRALLRQDLVLSAFTGPVDQNFTVAAGTSAIRVSIHAFDHDSSASAACSDLTLRDPASATALQQATGCAPLDTVVPNPGAGTWTIHLNLTNFTGNFEMTVTTATQEASR